MQAWNRIILNTIIEDDFIELENFTWFEFRNNGTADVWLGYNSHTKQIRLEPKECIDFPRLENGIYKGRIYIMFEGSGVKSITYRAIAQSNQEII